MSRKRVVLLEKEEAYGVQLMEYLKEHRQYGVELLLFTGMDSLGEYLLEVPFIHLLIAEKALYEGRQEESPCISEGVKKDEKGIKKDVPISGKIKKVMYFTEEKDDAEGIFRYQPMKKIMLNICAVLKEEKAEDVFSKKTARHEILCVFSPEGGSGKTELSVKMATQLGRRGRTFLFPLELFSEGCEREEKAGFSEFIYYLKQGDSDLSEKLSEMVFEKNNYFSLNPGSCPMDYLYLETKEMEKILQLLLDEGGYENIVFDLGFINDAAIKLMELSDKIYVPAARSKTGERKMEFWKETLIFMGKDDILEKQEIVKENPFGE